MKHSSHRVIDRSTWLLLAACALLATSCTREVPPEEYYSVGVADSVSFEGKSLTLHHFQLFSDGFLISKDLPPEDELKGKVLLQVVGLKRSTGVSVQIGTGLQVGGAPHDSPEAKALRERHVTLTPDEYDLTEYPVAGGEPRDIPAVDIDLIIVEPQ